MSTQAAAAVLRASTPARANLPQPVEQAGAYAVIEDRDGRVLTLDGDNGRTYLPGGRIEPGETPRRALLREIAEECGWSAVVAAPLGHSAQSILGGKVHLQASYWRAELLRPEATAPEQRLVWMDPEIALTRLHRPGDRRAVLMAFPALAMVADEAV